MKNELRNCTINAPFFHDGLCNLLTYNYGFLRGMSLIPTK
jgi:hypothetical protein